MTKKADIHPVSARITPIKKRAKPSDNAANPSTATFAVVGIGASAGGLEACKTFLNALPTDSGLAFVVIQHLDPNHDSLMAAILAKTTSLPVILVTKPLTVEPDHVYVIAPNTQLTLGDGILKPIKPPLRQRIRLPIDDFFFSLAEDLAERAIGLIFSGAGSDGSSGVRAIKGAGGLVLVQDPATAQFDGMIRSAIATGQVDALRPVENLPYLIIQYARHAYVWEDIDNIPAMADQVPTVLATLHTRSGYDFRGYKEGMLVRRITRRMGIRHVEKPADYIKLLRTDTAEIEQLARDMLIGVTWFFRKPQAFAMLTEAVVKPLVQQKAANEPIRVWAPGCASGEEAYSLAMMLTEQVQAAQKHCPLQIFATDIDQNALARHGRYSTSQVADITPERRKRFFVREDEHYQVVKPLREAVTFAVQNLISDPPFSRLDLISCRNLLIYLKPEVQRRVIELFQFALKPDRYLFLGNAESIGKQDKLFEPVSKTWRIYRRKPALALKQADFSSANSLKPDQQPRNRFEEVRSHVDQLAAVTQKLLLQHYDPAAVLINRHYQVLFFYGPTDRYLQQPTGVPTDDLLARARDGLSARLRIALQQTFKTGQSVSLYDLRVDRQEEPKRVRISVKPASVPKLSSNLLLVIFEEQHTDAPLTAATHNEDRESSLVSALEHELKVIREELHTTIAEQETTNEELKAANEEVNSINEELQSTNEELETAKEELQSMNEELSTVNKQLQDRLQELTHSNSDLINLLRSTDIATLFLDNRFCIKRFTPACQALFKLISSDIGRPLGDITRVVEDPSLRADAKQVLAELTPREKEVTGKEGRCYLRRVTLPHRGRAYRRSAGDLCGHHPAAPRRGSVSQ